MATECGGHGPIGAHLCNGIGGGGGERWAQMMGELLGLSPVGALTQLVKAEGAQVLINGIRLNCVKVAMGNSLGFVFYELAKDCLLVDGRTPPWQGSRVPS